MRMHAHARTDAHTHGCTHQCAGLYEVLDRHIDRESEIWPSTDNAGVVHAVCDLELVAELVGKVHLRRITAGRR